MAKINTLVEQWRDQGPAMWAEHRFGWLMLDGDPITLTPWQRAVLDSWWMHKRTVTTLALSNIKKTGKTTVDAILLAWRWLCLPGEHFACANDRDQAQSRQYKMVAAMCKRHPLLRTHVKVTKDRLLFEPTRSELIALPVNAATVGGANHMTSSHTETWAIEHEGSIRSYEELTPPPGTQHGLPALRVCDSYCGWADESELWHGLVDRGLAGKVVSRRWPIYQNGGLLLFHMAGEEAQDRCFRGTVSSRIAYYKDQKADLRDGTFQRLHLNQRAVAISAFITEAQWDNCILEVYSCPGPNPEIDLFVGIDIGIKHDHCAAVSVFKQHGALWLGPYRIWRPDPLVELAAVEDWLLRLHRDYGRAEMSLDPSQGLYLQQRLQRRGVRIKEYAQTTGNLTEMGGCLFDTIREGSLVIYPDSGDLRKHVLNARAKETDRGLRLIRTVARKKIDASIALAIAVVTSDIGKKEYGPARSIRYA